MAYAITASMTDDCSIIITVAISPLVAELLTLGML